MVAKRRDDRFREGDCTDSRTGHGRTDEKFARVKATARRAALPPAHRPPTARACGLGPVPDGGGTPGQAPHVDPAAPTERSDRGCHDAAQMQPYDRHCMAGGHRWLGRSTIQGSLLTMDHEEGG